MTKLIFWNCRGASKPTSRAHLQGLVRANNPIAVVLLETRRQTFSRKDVDRLIGRHWSFDYVPSIGKSGGIILLWLDDVIKVSDIIKNRQFIKALIHLPSGVKWQLGAIYADKYMHQRRVLWEELASMDMCNPTILGGDFNCVLRAEEKRGRGRFKLSNGPQEFANFINNTGFHEIPFTGNMFTWCNNQRPADRVLSRLDRVLLNAPALLEFPGSIVHHLPRIASDHAPLILEIDKLKFTTNGRGLKFEETWMSNPDAINIALGSWMKPVLGSPSKILEVKCARTIKALSQWSKFNAKKAAVIAKSLEEQIGAFQLREAAAALSDEELQSLRGLVASYNEVQIKLDTWWWQRAKCDWLQHGDRNSSFFQAAATQRKHENRIYKLNVENGIIIEQSQIEDTMVQHFSQRWCTVETAALEVLPCPREILSELEGQMLAVPPTGAEIKRTVFSFGRNKAPGCDGVTHSFFTHFWNFTMLDLIAAVQSFFATGSMEAKWKDTLVVLTPKRSSPSAPEHFRPISLCSTIYKVAAKIIANRMKPILRRLISEEQTAFVPGRLISDNCLLAQEIMHRIHTTQSKSGYMAMKIDMEKAFDRIQWSFVQRVLERFNFPLHWINLIMECITGPRYSLLINGSRSKWIHATCGLRQGCPLSPYLFILCSEFLSLLINSSNHPGIGIKISPAAPKLSHLLFADDTLIFGSATPGVAKEIAGILEHYCALSGEAVNASKSNILFGPKVPLGSQRDILRLLGHGPSHALKYLGITLRHGKVTSADFDFLIDKINSKIRSWGLRHLSLAGRIALIKSTLSAIPLHALAHSPMPISTINKINSLLASFFWSGMYGKQSIHFTKWTELCLPRDKGGLGFKHLIQWRRTLMGGFAARVAGADGSLLARIFGAKYADRNRFRHNRSHSKIWRCISLGSELLEKHTFWMVGNGKDISTLEDDWLGVLPLSRWPTFINIDALPNTVDGLLDPNSHWLLENMVGFSNCLIEVISRLPRDNIGGKDKLIWAHTEKVGLNANLLYGLECPQGLLEGSNIWKIRAQPRFLAMLWRALNHLLPTNDWLYQHRLRDNADCPWGCNQAETVAHIYGSCTIADRVRSALGRLSFNLNSTNTNLLDALLAELDISPRSKETKALAAIIYGIWKARNHRIHGEPFLQPSSIVLNSLMETSNGNWAAHLNLEQYWSPPPMGWLKINFDGSVHPNNMAGMGCSIRDHDGTLIIAKGARIHSRSVNMTEIRSALLGISIAKDFMNTAAGLILEGDSAFACSTLNRILFGLWNGEVEGMLARALKDCPRIEISLIDRSANSVADYVANLACSSDFLWERGMPLTQAFSLILSKDSMAM